MKILSSGNKKITNPDIKFFCNKCGCLFIAEYGEYKCDSSQIEGKSWHVNCPECGKMISTDIPMFCYYIEKKE